MNVPTTFEALVIALIGPSVAIIVQIIRKLFLAQEPFTTAIKYQEQQLERYRQQLITEQHQLDTYRKQLMIERENIRILRDTLTQAGIDVPTLENYDEP